LCSIEVLFAVVSVFFVFFFRFMVRV
jgi:hypothetical protein